MLYLWSFVWACLTGPIPPTESRSVNLIWTDGWTAQVWQEDSDRARVCHDCRCVDCCAFDIDEDGDVDLRDVAAMMN